MDIHGHHSRHESLSVKIEGGDPMGVIDKLVAQYEQPIGKASHEVCKEAAAALILGMPRGDVPASLLA